MTIPAASVVGSELSVPGILIMLALLPATVAAPTQLLGPDRRLPALGSVLRLCRPSTTQYALKWFNCLYGALSHPVLAFVSRKTYTSLLKLLCGLGI